MILSNKTVSIECAVCYAVCFVLTVINAILYNMGSGAAEFAWFAAAFGLIAVPLVAVRRVHPRDEKEAGIWIQWSARDLLFGIIVVCILLAPVAFGNHFVRTVIQNESFNFSFSNYHSLSTPLWYELLIQLLCIALPEEFFFRGYIQTAVQKIVKNTEKFAKYSVVLSIMISALLFALIHLPSGGAIRLLTFFPGLLFGFIRYKTNGLLGAIFCHAMCNMMMIVLNVHYFGG